MNNKIRKLEKEWLKKNKVPIDNILQDVVWNVKFVYDEEIRTGYIVKHKTFKNTYMLLPLSIGKGFIVFKKTHIQWIESAFNGNKLYYKNINWND
ncbi:hypothetical protein LQ356_01300 [Metamycoplasma faucium]|uniref:Phage protein n=1 Tax=Metamycoplasma faucium TaxID=56142 RepID=A0ABZ2TM43_9BACT